MPTTIIDQYEIRYRVHGERTQAPPLVLIHGAAGGQYVWLQQRRIDAAQVVTLDLPGHGGSHPALSDVNIGHYANLVAAFATTLGHEQFIPVGHSMGGAVALTLALDHRARIPALVLLATGARLPVSDFVFAAIDTSFDQLGELFAQTAYAPTTDSRLVARFTTGPLQVSRDQARADFEACARFDVRQRLEKIAVPTLLIAGDKDQLVSAGRMGQLAAGIIDSRIRTVPNAGHMVMQEQPATVNGAIGEFLESFTLEE